MRTSTLFVTVVALRATLAAQTPGIAAVAIKPTPPGTTRMLITSPSPGRVEIENQTLRQMIEYAFGPGGVGGKAQVVAAPAGSMWTGTIWSRRPTNR